MRRWQVTATGVHDEATMIRSTSKRNGRGPATAVLFLAAWLAAGVGAVDRAEVAAFADAWFTAALETGRFPGAVFAVVHEGEVLLARGYGVSSLTTREPVDAERTLFPVASVTKLVTATAVMQQVERGALDLHRDVTDYVDVLIPRASGAITLAHLLTHTAGLEDRYIGVAVPHPGNVPELGVLLREMPAQIRPAGELVMYSNHGYALAGHVVESVTGQPFRTYLREQILEPLGMLRARVDPSAALHADTVLSEGYFGGPGRHVEVPEFYIGVWPAGSLQATALEIAHFMLAHLEGGRIGDRRILQEATAAEMHRRQFTHDDRLAGWAYGFAEYTGSQRAVLHDGDIPGFNSRLFLLPELRLGFFTVNNGSDLQWRVDLTDAFLDRFVPAHGGAAHADADPDGMPRGAFGGHYRSARYPRTTADKLAGIAIEYRVREHADGSLTLLPPPIPGFPAGPSRWVPAGPLLYRNVEDDEYLAFREGEGGNSALLFAPLFGIPWAYHGIHWIESLRVQAAFAAFTIVLFLSAAAGWPVAALARALRSGSRGDRLRRRESRAGARTARIAAGSGAGVMLLFTVSLALVFQPLAVGDRTAAYVAFSLPLAAMLPTAAAVALTIRAWREAFWGTAARVHLTAVTAALILFLPFLAYWNLLGYRF
jgi:CubicO group peptidase (beta-lactamase class C family)